MSSIVSNMKKILSLVLPAILFIAGAFKSDMPAYRIFDKNGKEVSWTEVVNHFKKQDAVFFGELHNNAIAHWLQFELTKALYAENNQLVLGAEMFESDQQVIMNEYLDKKITEKNFEAEMRLWTNYKTDYKPLVDFAMEKNLRFIATNVPRRYASMVSKKGKDELLTLPDEVKKYMCPLPLEADTSLKSYSEMAKMMGGMGHGSGLNMVYAQALKDATMGWFISNNLPAKGILLHYNGAYHSDLFEGIVYYLKKYKPGVKTATITTVQQAKLDKMDEEYRGKADFILAVDEDMTSTH